MLRRRFKRSKPARSVARADKTSLVHVPVGKLSFTEQKLVDNATTVITSILRAKPAAAKGKYIKSVTLSSTMGPGVPLDTTIAEAAGQKLARLSAINEIEILKRMFDSEKRVTLCNREGE